MLVRLNMIGTSSVTLDAEQVLASRPVHRRKAGTPRNTDQIFQFKSPSLWAPWERPVFYWFIHAVN